MRLQSKSVHGVIGRRHFRSQGAVVVDRVVRAVAVSAGAIAVAVAACFGAVARSAAVGEVEDAAEEGL